MKIAAEKALRRLADQSVVVSAVLMSRFRRGKTPEDVEARLRARPAGERAFLVGATLAALLLATLLAAQAGLFGMALFFGAVILMVG